MTKVNFFTEYGILRNAYKQSEDNIIWGLKGKRVTLIKRVWLLLEFEEALEWHTLRKLGPGGPENVRW